MTSVPPAQVTDASRMKSEAERPLALPQVSGRAEAGGQQDGDPGDSQRDGDDHARRDPFAEEQARQQGRPHRQRVADDGGVAGADDLQAEAGQHMPAGHVQEGRRDQARPDPARRLPAAAVLHDAETEQNGAGDAAGQRAELPDRQFQEHDAHGRPGRAPDHPEKHQHDQAPEGDCGAGDCGGTAARGAGRARSGIAGQRGPGARRPATGSPAGTSRTRATAPTISAERDQVAQAEGLAEHDDAADDADDRAPSACRWPRRTPGKIFTTLNQAK